MITLTSAKQKETEIWIDRRSVLGNPFLMLNERERENVCSAYDLYFDYIVHGDFTPSEAIKLTLKNLDFPLTLATGFPLPTRKAFLDELFRIEKEGESKLVKLKCHCSPRACHGDTLINHFALQLVELI